MATLLEVIYDSYWYMSTCYVPPTESRSDYIFEWSHLEFAIRSRQFSAVRDSSLSEDPLLRVNRHVHLPRMPFMPLDSTFAIKLRHPCPYYLEPTSRTSPTKSCHFTLLRSLLDPQRLNPFCNQAIRVLSAKYPAGDAFTNRPNGISNLQTLSHRLCMQLGHP